MRIAYFSAAVQLVLAASKHPSFARVQSLSDRDEPLYYSSYMHNGAKGVLCHTEAAPPAPGDLGEGFECVDGLVYFRYGPLPDQMELSRTHAVAHADFKTHRGFKLSIPIAICSPRAISFAGLNSSPYVDKFAVLADELAEDFLECGEDGIEMATDPRIFALIQLALERTYRVTAELLDELSWLTDNDVNPIIEIIYGISPKLSGQGAPISA